MNKVLKWGLIGFAVLIGISVLASLGSSSPSTEKTAESQVTESNQPTTDQKEVEKPKEVALAGLNEPVSDGDLTFTVLSVEKKKSVGSQYTKRDAQGMFYVITIKLENTGKKTITFDSSMAKVMDSESREFDRSIEGQTALGMASGKVDLFLQQIQPTLSYSGDLVFDLPEEISKPVLVLKNGVFSKGVKVNLAE